MRLIRVLAAILGLASPASISAQAAAPTFATWYADTPSSRDNEMGRWVWGSGPVVPPAVSRDTRSHTRTGLLIGGIVGGVATAVFLAGFCNDPDTKCEADEVGRAVLFIGAPIAAAGALIGSLIRTEREPEPSPAAGPTE